MKAAMQKCIKTKVYEHLRTSAEMRKCITDAMDKTEIRKRRNAETNACRNKCMQKSTHVKCEEKKEKGEKSE